ncbi:hypothetical protein PR202_ga26304 [Eleusine coracana subsp. coracana]|uniref:RNase H type-1 domain-containing protein n=1 Tax=Eleusine coracana subsp. coracana TaxID=191504 RepID=A0AAV5DDM6_ELECO|nr:hypothetical protein PR202_ga26304 [Eleusine coracana subsp. coracana]
MVLVLLWQWWSARNKANAGGKLATIAEVCSSVTYHVKEFQKLQKPPKVPKPAKTAKWSVPPDHSYKINIDGAFLAESNSGGWGFMIRDQTGSVLEAGAGNIQWAADALKTEALAAMAGVQRAAYWGMPKIILQTDAANLGSAITFGTWDNSPGGNIFMQIREFLVDNFVSYEVKGPVLNEFL